MRWSGVPSPTIQALAPGIGRHNHIGRRFLAALFAGVALAGGVLAGLAQSVYTAPCTFTTIAGNAGYGIADGVGPAARFYYPQGIATDAAGNLYVSDEKNNTLRLVTRSVTGNQTNWLVSTIAGTAGLAGTVDGTGAAARFSDPHGVALDPSGNIYVADFANHTIRRVSPVLAGGITNWQVVTIAGAAGVKGTNDGPGLSARFYLPTGVAVDDSGNVFVADQGNATIRKLTPVVTAGVTNWEVITIAGAAGSFGSTDGDGSVARFFNLYGVALDAGGNLYASDYGACTIRLLTPGLLGGWTVSTIAGSVGGFGSANGTGAAAQFYNPFGLAVASNGTVFVVDAGNNAIRTVTPEVSPGVTNWVVGTIAGVAGTQGSADGTGTKARFFYPNEVAVDAAGVVFVTDTINNTVRRLRPAAGGAGAWIVDTVAGLAAPGVTVDGVGSAAGFSAPDGIARDQSGNLYVTDYNDSVVRQLIPSLVAGQTNWTVTTIAGSPGNPGSANGGGSAAQFNSPDGIVAGAGSVLFVSDTANSTIRQIVPTLVGGQTQWNVGTIAGYPGVAGTNDGVGTQALFGGLGGLAIDNSGTLYAADSGAATIRQISPVTLGGIPRWRVSTIAGLGGVIGTNDGPGLAARFNYPYGITVDAAGNLFVTDEGNATVRKLAPNMYPGATNWMVTTIAGGVGIRGTADGIGANAQFNTPSGISVDAAGRLFVADANSSVVRELVPAFSGGQTNWIVSTVAGLVGVAGAVDGTGSAARFNSPWGVLVDPAGTVFVTEYVDGTLRQGTSPPVILLGPPLLVGAGLSIGFYLPAGFSASFHLLAAPTPQGPWAAAAGILTTNVPGFSYAFSIPPSAGGEAFYRVQSP